MREHPRCSMEFVLRAKCGRLMTLRAANSRTGQACISAKRGCKPLRRIAGTLPFIPNFSRTAATSTCHRLVLEKMASYLDAIWGKRGLNLALVQARHGHGAQWRLQAHRLSRKCGTFNTSRNFCKCNIACHDHIIAKWRESAVVRGAKLSRWDVL